MTTIGQWLTGNLGASQVSNLVAKTPVQQSNEATLHRDLTTEERLRLPRLLNSLPPVQFETLVFTLKPPAGVISPNTAPQGNRTIDLLTWLESSTGPGFGKLYETLDRLGIDGSTAPQADTVERLSFAIAGSIDKTDYAKLKAIVALLQDMADDTSISILDIEEGSIKLTLGGSPEGLAKLKALFDQKELTEVEGTEVLDISFLPAQLEGDQRSSSTMAAPIEAEASGLQDVSSTGPKGQIATSLLPKQGSGEGSRTADPEEAGLRLSSSSPSNHPPHPSVHNPLKRALDVVGSMIGLIILAAIFIPVAIAIKIDSPGPIFYRQTRCGLYGQQFQIWKLRTMVQGGNTTEGPIFKNQNDTRVTRLGRFLRRTSLDEFPLFWSVLKGDMSLVGTRPPTPDEVERYSSSREWQRLAVKPGVTGLWQVQERHSVRSFDEVVQLDLNYQEQWSFLFDLMLIWKTVMMSFHNARAMSRSR